MREPISPSDSDSILPEPPTGFRWSIDESWPTLVCLALLPRVHGWTTRALELSRADEAVPRGWTQLAARCGVVVDALVRMRQVHGSAVLQAGPTLETRPVGDGLVSRDPQPVLTVAVADCAPILLADRRSGAVGAVHAGWRSTCAGIAQRAVERFVELFDSRPNDIAAAIGPCIGPCCYEVGPELREAFRSHGWSDDSLGSWFDTDRRRFDLWTANRDQLLESGVPEESLSVSGLCTACHPALFHSFRRDGQSAGRMVGFIRAG